MILWLISKEEQVVQMTADKPSQTKLKKNNVTENKNQNALEDIDFPMALLLVIISIIAFPIFGLIATILLSELTFVWYSKLMCWCIYRSNKICHISVFSLVMSENNELFKKWAVLFAVVGIAIGAALYISFYYYKYFR